MFGVGWGTVVGLDEVGSRGVEVVYFHFGGAFLLLLPAAVCLYLLEEVSVSVLDGLLVLEVGQIHVVFLV